MASTIMPAIPMPAEPAPKKKMRWSVSLALMICRAVVRPAMVMLAAPWMSHMNII